jgi:hypothetical protein
LKRYQEDASAIYGLQLPKAELREAAERLKVTWDPSAAVAGASTDFLACQTAFFGIYDGYAVYNPRLASLQYIDMADVKFRATFEIIYTPLLKMSIFLKWRRSSSGRLRRMEGILSVGEEAL